MISITFFFPEGAARYSVYVSQKSPTPIPERGGAATGSGVGEESNPIFLKKIQ